jgi:hypothetical protein
MGFYYEKNAEGVYSLVDVFTSAAEECIAAHGNYDTRRTRCVLLLNV